MRLLLFCILLLFTHALLSAQVEVVITGSNINQFGQMQIDIQSSPDSYYFLYCRHDLPDGPRWPVQMARGVTGTLTLTDPLKALSLEHYRVEKYSITSPGDYDLDGIDDLTEFDDFGCQSPFNTAISIDSGYGSVAIADKATFEYLSYTSSARYPFTSTLQGLQSVKFLIVHSNTENPIVYFMNTNKYFGHSKFINTLINSGTINSLTGGTKNIDGIMSGELSFHPEVVAPSGSTGLYHFKFHMMEEYPFERIRMVYELLMPIMHLSVLYLPVNRYGICLSGKLHRLTVSGLNSGHPLECPFTFMMNS